MANTPSANDQVLADLAVAELSVCLVTHVPRVGVNRNDPLQGQAWQVSLYRGQGQVAVGQVAAAVNGQLIVLVPPGVKHRARQSGRELSSLNLQFTTAAVGLASIGPFTLSPTPASRAGRLERDFQIILEDWQMPEAGAQLSINARAKSLLVDILRLWMQSDADAVSPVVVEAACRYMAVQYGQALTVREIAMHCGVRADSLCRAFRRHMDTSPRGYLQELRIKQARNLLIAGVSVTDVAEQTGFGSVHYFSRAFKRSEGHSPTDWRRQHVEGEAAGVLA